MTQPRKEQVKNLKTKYTRFTGAGTLSIGGGPVQTVSNTGLEAFYDNFLGVMKTGVVGGAETSAPAILYGGAGPYSLGIGDSFNITITGVNGDAPVNIIVQAGDIVTLGGVPVVTTSRMAARINVVLAGLGVTSAGAANVNGILVLTSVDSGGVLVGDSAVMTVSEVTPGILTVLGFSTSASVTAQGTTAPKRGVITVSADGLGGIVQLRRLDSAVPDTVNAVMRHGLAGVQIPETVSGQPAYARLRAFPGPVINGRNLKFSFYRNGPIRPQFVTGSGAQQSTFSSLTGADSVAVIMAFGNGQTLNYNVTFSGVTTVQDVVDKFNLAYSSASASATLGQLDSTVPQVFTKMAAPFRFTDPGSKDSFFFSLNGLTPIHVNPPAGMYSAIEFATVIGNAIGAAGQAGEGQAFTYQSPSGSVHVGIRSLNADVTVSSVGVYPGNPGGSTPGAFMETLDMIGLVPGLYKAGTVAELFGLDEVNLHCPSPLPGAQLTISGPALVMAKLGLPTGVNVSVTNGIQAVTAPTSHALVPEMVEFHEERDDYDSITQDFDNKAPFGQLRPQDGASNVGLDQILSPDGKVNASLLPQILGFLGLDRMRLGSRMLNNITDSLLTPKISASHDVNVSGFANLLFESSADTNVVASNYVLRIYTYLDKIFITQNAKIVQLLSDPAAFTRDSPANNATMLEFGGLESTVKLSVWPFTGGATWGLSDWKTNVRLDSVGGSSEGDLLRLGEFLTSNTTDTLKPRVGLPSIPDSRILVFEGNGTGSATGLVRVYLNLAAGGLQSFLQITINARWDGGFFNKDVSGQRALKYTFGGFNYESFEKLPTSNSPWVELNWDINHLSTDYSQQVSSFGGALNIGGNLATATQARVISQRATPNVDRRTLLFESPSGGPFSLVPIRIYLVSTSSTMKDGFQFTYNARWEQGLDKFVQDVPAERSFSWSMQQNRFWMLSKNAGSGTWNEDYSFWDKYSLLDHTPGFQSFTTLDGVFKVDGASTFSNPVKTNVPFYNAVYAKTMVKSWGVGQYLSSSPLVIDGYNSSAIGVNAFAWDMVYAAGIGGTPCTVTTILDGTSAQGGTQRCVMKVFLHIFPRIIFVITDYNGNFFPQASIVTAYHVTWSQT